MTWNIIGIFVFIWISFILQVNNPQRNLPLAMAIALSVRSMLYMSVAAVIVGLVPYNKLNPDTPISSAFFHFGMKWAA